MVRLKHGFTTTLHQLSYLFSDKAATDLMITRMLSSDNV